MIDCLIWKDTWRAALVGTRNFTTAGEPWNTPFTSDFNTKECETEAPLKSFKEQAQRLIDGSILRRIPEMLMISHYTFRTNYVESRHQKHHISYKDMKKGDASCFAFSSNMPIQFKRDALHV